MDVLIYHFNLKCSCPWLNFSFVYLFIFLETFFFFFKGTETTFDPWWRGVAATAARTTRGRTFTTCSWPMSCWPASSSWSTTRRTTTASSAPWEQPWRQISSTSWRDAFCRKTRNKEPVWSFFLVGRLTELTRPRGKGAQPLPICEKINLDTSGLSLAYVVKV